MEYPRYQTLADVLAAAEAGQLREWVVAYLQGEGGNPGLAGHILARPGATLALVDYPLAGLKRLTGPEDSMIWREDPAIWERGVSGFLERMGGGVMPLPIIVTDFWDDPHIADGTHRHEALLRAGEARYWVLFILRDAAANGLTTPTA